MRQFKPLKGQKHIKASHHANQMVTLIHQESLLERERSPKVKRNGVLISNKNK